MTTAYTQPSRWQRLRPLVKGFDGGLLMAVLLLACLGLLTMYSAGYDHGTRFVDHLRNMGLAAVIMFTVAQVPPHKLMRVAVPLYTAGVVLLVAVALFGITKKGATRWLNVGVAVIQPSEILKIALPLMLAWWFQKCESQRGQLLRADFWVAAALLLLPFLLVAKQPDLGTAILVFSGGFFVIFFAGLSWMLIWPVVLIGVVGVGLLIGFSDAICEPGVNWHVLREYQKHRVCTLLDPTTDPLGKGFHIIQGMIAIGSGGVFGKGFMQGTQTHLEFIPERTTDFIFAAFSEEFGLLGVLALLGCFAFLLLRGLMIAASAPTLFARLLAAAITLSLFTYMFVNIGMVSGMLPVVGVPLPFISYGGTAMASLGLALGLLLAIARSRGLMQR
jgi:rod shape determining protein RodA